MLEGEEAARCEALKCGGTYADFVPLIPRDARARGINEAKEDVMGEGQRTERRLETSGTVYNSI
jgi:hypothetical protein